MPAALTETPAYRLWRPAPAQSAVVFASPHSGRDYPAALRARTALSPESLRSSEDAYVDRLLETAPGVGAALIAARLPRAWVDLNRAPDELDPALIEDLGRRAGSGPRVAAGLGVIPRVVSGSRAIYSGKIGLADAEARLAEAWRPYHDALGALLEETRARFGRAILLDMHSMPSEAIEPGPRGAPEIVLGDRYGASARAATVAAIEEVFTGLGLRVARNAPFAGAYIAARYGRPAEGIEVVQVEISRALYLDEATVRPGLRFGPFAALMARAVASLAAIGAEGGRLAAE
ncbi:N-formylglutamate amidohydrolase [Rhodobacter xanthinilyticus]|uniref:N-formylglutamate amidohydrolase n=1 Tax=Rhodobacter xanthinilyticus TaxID=1850250 RepID=UPI000B326B64|nr:N-formylglutamate amidohydrolase [Rhodobacter xanthinilyticus]